MFQSSDSQLRPMGRSPRELKKKTNSDVLNPTSPIESEFL